MQMVQWLRLSGMENNGSYLIIAIGCLWLGMIYMLEAPKAEEKHSCEL